MILSERYAAWVTAIVGLYVVGLVAAISGLAPEVCTKRALIGAGVGYVGGYLAAKGINAILTSALIDHLAAKQREDERADQASRG